ncbi:MAG TPA: MarR family winged helix-turn-helix transcriptional regulator [Xanthobacteraceae bacterium]|nr:MarR family winged helix-turn-helix transcriptional regulator [Xanthobacteraceae bacterium]
MRPSESGPSRAGRSIVVDLGPGIPPVRRVATALARRFYQICVTLSADSVAAADLTPLQFAVLACLNKKNGEPGIDQNGLAARLGVERSHVSLLVEELGKRGLVERRVNGADRRARILRLTPKGDGVFDRLRGKNTAANARVLDPLTAKERELLFDLLIRVIKQNTAYARPGAGRRRRRAGQSGSGQGRSSSVRPPSAALSKQE